MELKAFEGINKNELSMIEVAHAMLEESGEVLEFSQLVAEIKAFLELSDEVLEARMTRFYTDLNIDGSFISLGENRWGLRSWYPIDSIDEEIVSSIDDDELKKRRKKRKKVNAFGDEDVIDYNDDDPEDDIILDDDAEEDDDDVEDDIKLDGDVEEDDEDVEVKELEAYKSDLSELGADEDIEDEVSADEDLSIISDDFDDEEDEEDEL
ncbi:DNA-directed RNA polymerase subunit delta [Granulicatella balaenopterae]|uniref:Probable DNA-directed RNA polymerase subunit delta n=1 Tax=Granulicatella balaenopterae TaxID=137733 RepID=A0A1H9MHH9_9LACT|nr:DNA-directed RNA polymerase subunit delta [Granulicatella balaenopterae]SER22907.1 DNA-directed RNA polymerase subunit delta [Granulicatella balaenopterae]